MPSAKERIVLPNGGSALLNRCHFLGRKWLESLRGLTLCSSWLTVSAAVVLQLLVVAWLK